MLALAIQVLWFLFGLICLCGVVALVLYGINTFVYPMPARLVQGIWFLVLLLAVIAILTVFAGGGIHSLSFR
jgi:uncharacterized membrane protein